jgi:N-acetylmuramoyl-L-alanine amidase
VPGHPVLRLGAHGAAVRALQRRLIALRYFDVATADGVFGPGTYHSVIAFQKVQRLARDGVVGPATWARLARPRVPVPRYRMATASLEVNLAKQVLYYIRGGVIRRILDASTGRPGCPRPLAGSASTGATPTDGSPARSARCTGRTTSTAVTPCTV